VNTDDNLYLEFSAPFSFYSFYLEGENISLLLKHRESIVPYLVVPADSASQKSQKKKWSEYEKLFPLVDEVHADILKGKVSSPEFDNLTKELEKKAPSFAPWLALKGGVQ
jgi:spermidine synthase